MVKQITGNAELLALLDQYAAPAGEGEAKPSDIIRKLADNVQNPELIVPVLGSQGMGKSTLINAILGANILPNDADETTCVPVEIRYGTREKALVYFQSGETEEIEISCDSLRVYVDNNVNGGNRKCVSHIALETPNELLKNGLVIVDLPGVGSLTRNNHETTMRYIQRLCTAIFIIPTVPTIRRTEEVFIRGAWGSFSSAIFVQNRWDGETDAEVADSVAFNSLVLQNIAKKANTVFSGKICVVNAYQAIVSRLHGDHAACERSNLPELLGELNNLGENRVRLEAANFKAKVQAYLEAALATVVQYIKESQMNEEQRRAAREKIREEFGAATKEIQGLVDDVLACVAEEKRKAYEFAREASKTAVENLRADIRKLIDSGVVDGEQLSTAFSDYQEKYLLDTLDAHYDYMMTMNYRLSQKLEALAERITIERASSFEALKFDNGQAFKYEKGLKFGFDLAGAVGGTYVAAVVGGMAFWESAKVGAVLGSAGGPIGIVVGIIAGLGVGLIASFLGKKTKESITAQRGAQAKRELEPYIKKYGNQISTQITSNIDTAMTGITAVLQTYMEDRKVYYAEMRKEKEQAVDAEHEDQYDVSQLSRHHAYLESIKEQLL